MHCFLCSIAEGKMAAQRCEERRVYVHCLGRHLSMGIHERCEAFPTCPECVQPASNELLQRATNYTTAPPMMRRIQGERRRAEFSPARLQLQRQLQVLFHFGLAAAGAAPLIIGLRKYARIRRTYSPSPRPYM